MSARALALELSQLRTKERASLLAELPETHRAEIEGLLADVESLLKPAPRAFEAHIEEALTRPHEPFDALNPGQLRLLLAAEHPVLQQRLASIVRSGQLDTLAPAVRAAVEEHLAQRLKATHLHADTRRRSTSRWWTRLIRRAR